jgi:hypothetical protein
LGPRTRSARVAATAMAAHAPPPYRIEASMSHSLNRMVVPVMIEIPRGSRNKYEYDETLGRIRFDRLLHSPVRYQARQRRYHHP